MEFESGSPSFRLKGFINSKENIIISQLPLDFVFYVTYAFTLEWNV